jgi:hypothetical protein
MAVKKIQIEIAFLLILAVWCPIGPLSAFDQGQSTYDQDSVHRKEGVSPYLMGQVQYGRFSDRGSFFGGLGLGILLKRRWQMEADFIGIINRYVKKVIFPEDYRLKYWHLGGSVKYSMVDLRKWYGFISVRGGWGRTQWIPFEDSGDSFTDNVFLLTPELGVGFKVVPFISFEYSIGYNRAFDVEIIGLDQDALNGFEMNLKIKIIKNNNSR